jgi:hypothetical protein
MRPDPSKAVSSDLFRSSLEAILDPEHELLKLAAQMNGKSIRGPRVMSQTERLSLTGRMSTVSCAARA